MASSDDTKRPSPSQRGACRACLLLALLSFLLIPVFLATGAARFIGPAVILLFGLLAVAVGKSRSYSAFAFTLWVAAFVAAAMFYPAAFHTWSGLRAQHADGPAHTDHHVRHGHAVDSR